VEIRRIEGILPIEGVSRELPLKLENFSYYDMKKLLSQVSPGAGKGDKKEEFDRLLRATFLEYTKEGKALLRVGSHTVTATVEGERAFFPGQELLLKVKSVSPGKVELSLVEPPSLTTFLKRSLPLIFKVEPGSFYRLFTPQFVAFFLEIVRESYPEFHRKLKEYFEGGKLFPSKELVVSLLILLEPESYKKLKEKMAGEFNREKIRELLYFAVGALLLFNSLKIAVLPLCEEDLCLRAVFGSYQGLSSCFVEGQSPLGDFMAFFKSLGSSISCQVAATGELKGLISVDRIKELLEEEGLNPVLVEFKEPSELEKLKRELLKGSVFEITV
jgi:hypothetical protein